MLKVQTKIKQRVACKCKAKTYIFKVELVKEDGVWTAVVPALPGCNAWGDSQEEALTALQENTKAYVEILIEKKRPVPIEEKHLKIPINSAAIAITV